MKTFWFPFGKRTFSFSVCPSREIAKKPRLLMNVRKSLPDPTGNWRLLRDINLNSFKFTLRTHPFFFKLVKRLPGACLPPKHTKKIRNVSSPCDTSGLAGLIFTQIFIAEREPAMRKVQTISRK